MSDQVDNLLFKHFPEFIRQFALLILWGSAIYHLVMGALCFVSEKTLKAALRLLYKVELFDNMGPAAQYAMKPIGAFALFTSSLCFCAVFLKIPQMLLAMKMSLILLFALRAWSRSTYRDLFYQAFAVPWARSRVNVIFNYVLCLILLFSVF